MACIRHLSDDKISRCIVVDCVYGTLASSKSIDSIIMSVLERGIQTMSDFNEAVLVIKH